MLWDPGIAGENRLAQVCADGLPELAVALPLFFAEERVGGRFLREIVVRPRVLLDVDRCV